MMSYDDVMVDVMMSYDDIYMMLGIELNIHEDVWTVRFNVIDYHEWLMDGWVDGWID